MKYGQGFWCVEKGVRLARRTYPRTVGFEYGDGDRGELLLADWCFDYVPPGMKEALRVTIMGNPEPVPHVNAFDFDWASIPRALRWMACDKADYRIRAASLAHDMLFCAHLPEMGLGFANRLLYEIMEAYGRDEEDGGERAEDGGRRVEDGGRGTEGGGGHSLRSRAAGEARR